ncbi:MAG: MOSC domain-containing protein [Acaryochloris sp. CRU_2_0]|nr:MOSC domain-containing protein [Acaryochloris sp. CRU_2_0]
MQLLSVNVGLPREVLWRGRTVSTGIFKEPVEGQVMVLSLNLDGDAQADLTVHGGADKAVYAYPVEHYGYWQAELPEMDLPWGMFGENLTIRGLWEDQVYIGDRFRIGTAEIMVTQPRMPCYKLGIKFGRTDIVKRFLESRLTGFYFSVLKEGVLRAGDAIEQLYQADHNVTVTDITRLYAQPMSDRELLRRALEVQALPASWRDYFQQQLEKRGS